MTRLLAAALPALASTCAAAALASAAPVTSHDPPVIVPWHRIGAADLSGTRASVRRVYAADSRIHLGPDDDDTFDAPDSDGRGYLSVAYDGDEVIDVATSSDRYRTPDGIGVGSRLPTGRRWYGLAYHSTGAKPGYGQWTGTFCHRGIRTFVRLAVQEGRVDYVSIHYGAGKVCGRQLPRFPLTAQDLKDIASVIRIDHLRVSIDSKRWVSGWTSGRHAAQAQFVVLEHRGRSWAVVDFGTWGVGCGRVPIKPLTQIGGACGPHANAP